MESTEQALDRETFLALIMLPLQNTIVMELNASLFDVVTFTLKNRAQLVPELYFLQENAMDLTQLAPQGLTFMCTRFVLLTRN